MHADFFLNTEEGLLKVNSREIHYIEANGKRSTVVTSKGSFGVTSRLSLLERDQLPPEIFCRVHRSFIVPLDNISTLSLEEVMVHDRRIPVEKAYRNKLLVSLKVIW